MSALTCNRQAFASLVREIDVEAHEVPGYTICATMIEKGKRRESKNESVSANGRRIYLHVRPMCTSRLQLSPNGITQLHCSAGILHYGAVDNRDERGYQERSSYGGDEVRGI